MTDVKQVEVYGLAWGEVVDIWRQRLVSAGIDASNLVTEIRAVGEDPATFHINEAERASWWPRKSVSLYPVVNWDYSLHPLLTGNGGSGSRSSKDMPRIPAGAQDVAQMLARHCDDIDMVAAILIVASISGMSRGSGVFRWIEQAAWARLVGAGSELNSGNGRREFLPIHQAHAPPTFWEDTVETLADEHIANLTAWAPVRFSCWTLKDDGYHHVTDEEATSSFFDKMSNVMSGMWDNDETAVAIETKPTKPGKDIGWEAMLYPRGSKDRHHAAIGKLLARTGRNPDDYGRPADPMAPRELQIRHAARKQPVRLLRRMLPGDDGTMPTAIDILLTQEGLLQNEKDIGLFLDAHDRAVARMTELSTDGRDPFEIDASTMRIDPLAERIMRHLNVAIPDGISCRLDEYAVHGSTKLDMHARCVVPGEPDDEETLRLMRRGREKPTVLELEVEDGVIVCKSARLDCPIHASLEIRRYEGASIVNTPYDIIGDGIGMELADFLQTPVLDGMTGIVIESTSRHRGTTMTIAKGMQ